MRHGRIMAMVAATAFSLTAAYAADQAARTTAPQPAAATPATSSAPQKMAPGTTSTTLSSSALVQGTDSPLVRAAKAAQASRVHDPKLRIVINANNLVIGPHSGSAAPATANAPGQTDMSGRSWATGNSGNASAIAERDRAERDRRTSAEKARQAALRTEQKRMAEQADEPYPNDVSEDQITERQTNIPTEIKNPPPPPPL